MTGPGSSGNEFVRVIALEGARPPRVRFAIEASPTECAALARRFGLVRIDRLTAEGQADLGGGGLWRLRGNLRAEVVQSCVVTLEPFAAIVTDRFEIDYAVAGPADDQAELDLTEADVEPLPADGRLDVGEVVAQQLSLALDPFPRKPGVEFTGAAPGSAADDPGKVRPFADLAGRLGRRDRS